jgi:hypothetical protein
MQDPIFAFFEKCKINANSNFWIFQKMQNQCKIQFLDFSKNAKGHRVKKNTNSRFGEFLLHFLKNTKNMQTSSLYHPPTQINP